MAESATTLSFGPGVSELSSLKSIEDSDILGNTKARHPLSHTCLPSADAPMPSLRLAAS